MTVSAQQAWAIGHLVAELRPDWQAEGVVAAIKRIADRDPFIVALACIRAAADSNARTPGVIPTDGTHWLEGIRRETTSERNHLVPCSLHPSQTLPCGLCARDRVPADEDNTTLALARAELAQVLANRCPHKVSLTRGKCADCQKPAPKIPEPEEAPA